MDNKKRVIKIIGILDRLYPEAACSLDFVDPLQLLISTQLAAQCTDERVNLVTRDLFKKYGNARDFADANLHELESEIRSTGFYHNKARNIINCCKMLVEFYDGKVPDNMENLLELPGVGRKTANLVLGDAFGIPGIVVDTHAGRVSRRIGLTANENPEKVEYDLLKIVPVKDQSKFGHQLVYHGRAVCNARKPRCEICEIKHLCEHGKNV